MLGAALATIVVDLARGRRGRLAAGARRHRPRRRRAAARHRRLRARLRGRHGRRSSSPAASACARRCSRRRWRKQLPGGVALAWALLLRLWVTVDRARCSSASSVAARALAAARRARRERSARARRSRRPRPPAGARRPALLALPPVAELDDDERARLFRRSAVVRHRRRGPLRGGLRAALVAQVPRLHGRPLRPRQHGRRPSTTRRTGTSSRSPTGDAEAAADVAAGLARRPDPRAVRAAVAGLAEPRDAARAAGRRSSPPAPGRRTAWARASRVTRAPARLLAGAYLLYPALGFLVLNEFHPVALATPLLLWAFLYLEEDRWLRALPFLVLAAACKETVPLVIAVMGVYFALRKRSWRPLHRHGRRRRLLRRRGLGRSSRTSTAARAPSSRATASYGDGAGEVVKTRAPPSRPDGRRPRSRRPNLDYWLRAAVAARLHVAAEPADAAHRGCPSYCSTRSRRRSTSAASSSTTRRSEIPFLFAAAVLGVMRLWRWLGGGFRSAEKAMAGPARAAARRWPCSCCSRRWPATTSWARCRSRCRAPPTTAGLRADVHDVPRSTRRWR